MQSDRFTVLGCLAILLTCDLGFAGEPPQMLVQDAGVEDSQSASGRRTSFAIMRMPDNRFAFFDQSNPSPAPLTLSDRSGRRHSLLPALPTQALTPGILESGVLANTQVLLTPQHEILNVFVKSEAIDKERVPIVGLPRFLNVWMRTASASNVEAPRMIWQGYNGSQMEYEQLPSGRILVPFGSFQPHGKAVPPLGRHKIVVQYSDDQGKTWTESQSKLVSPCYENFNGSNEGACEPAIERLKDGRIWMLFRTQAGFLYESFSSDEGTTWSTARASRFSTSTGPPNIMRFHDGSLIVCWNNCEMPPRADGIGVYGGRDALHIAVSHDDGQTWRGFREIYLDHRRNDNPAKTGDRGTAYPLAAYTSDNHIVVLAGQGSGGRNPILIDPNWIVETTAHTDFSDGLDECSVYKHYGPAKAWWRARAVGCELVPNPTEPHKRCLKLRKPDDLPPDGAVWNFPNAWSGSVSTRIYLKPGCQGGSISLNDRMFDPSNDDGERLAVYRMEWGEDRQIGKLRLESDRWYDVRIQWDLARSQAELLIDDQSIERLPLLNGTLNGISYLRLRSMAKTIDPDGFYVDDAHLTIRDAHAPQVQPADLRTQEKSYIEKVVPHWK